MPHMSKLTALWRQRPSPNTAPSSNFPSPFFLVSVWFRLLWFSLFWFDLDLVGWLLVYFCVGCWGGFFVCLFVLFVSLFLLFCFVLF